jgi:hypothetical protein
VFLSSHRQRLCERKIDKQIVVDSFQKGCFGMNKKSFIAGVCWAFISFLFLVSNSSAAPISPSGGIGSKTWDLTITGANYGAAYLTFSDDGTERLITGYVNVAPGRGIDGETITIGFTYVYGQWSFDEKNRVVAYLNNEPTEDVRFDVINLVGGVSKNQKKLTLSGQTDYGKLKFSGGVAAALDELPNPWTVVVNKKESDLTFVEIFSMEPSGDLNLYHMAGLAANHCLKGSALLSKLNDFVVTIFEAEMPDSYNCADVPENNWTGYAAYGKLNLNTLVGNLKRGGEEGDGSKKVSMGVVME